MVTMKSKYRGKRVTGVVWSPISITHGHAVVLILSCSPSGWLPSHFPFQSHQAVGVLGADPGQAEAA